MSTFNDGDVDDVRQRRQVQHRDYQQALKQQWQCAAMNGVAWVMVHC